MNAGWASDHADAVLWASYGGEEAAVDLLACYSGTCHHLQNCRSQCIRRLPATYFRALDMRGKPTEEALVEHSVFWTRRPCGTLGMGYV